MNVFVWAGVVVIGGAGSVLRFLVDGLVSSAAGRDFPFGTMVINISGAVVLGLLAGLALSDTQALLAGTAAVGSYTTFSTWMLEPSGSPRSASIARRCSTWSSAWRSASAPRRSAT